MEKKFLGQELVVFEENDAKIAISFEAESVVLIGFGDEIKEPMVSHGPFVMNTRAEISVAIKDYEAGKF